MLRPNRAARPAHPSCPRREARVMLNVIIVDDGLAGRRTLREFCAAESDLNVVGEFGDGAAALAAVRTQRPQLLFLDIQMDPLNGIDLARALSPQELPS